MATKAEILEAATALTAKHKTPAAFNTELLELLAVKTGGASFKLEDVAVLDKDGKPVFILDSKLSMWVPVKSFDGSDLFYVKPDTTLGYSRWAKASETASKKADKVFKATKDAVFKDLMAGNIDQTAAQKLMETAEKAQKTVTVPANLVAYSDKPEASVIAKAHSELKVISDKAAAAKAAAKEEEAEEASA